MGTGPDRAEGVGLEGDALGRAEPARRDPS